MGAAALAVAAVPGAPGSCVAAGRRRRNGRRRVRRRARPGSRRCWLACRWCSTEADVTSASRTACSPRRARRVCLAFPIAGPRGRALPGHGPPCACGGARRRPRRARGRASGSMRTGRCLLVFGGSQGARSINLGALDAFIGDGRVSAEARLPRRSTSPGGATIRRLAAGSRRRAGRTSTRCSSTSRTSADPLAACDLVLARAGGSVFELAAAGQARDPGSVPPRHGAPPARQCGMDGGCRGRARDRGLRAAPVQRSFERPPSCSPTRRGSSGWPRPAAALARPDAAARIAAEVLSAARSHADRTTTGDGA